MKTIMQRLACDEMGMAIDMAMDQLDAGEQAEAMLNLKRVQACYMILHPEKYHESNRRKLVENALRTLLQYKLDTIELEADRLIS